ncbi:protein FAM117B-like isoform X1 [Paramormyrops kingsleyae]|uniref:protein FAM117B-like isoform X1 n=1 Tax=Paramormyrops kingsleyae TaxID=1676925 RepID=UPI003B9725F9
MFQRVRRKRSPTTNNVTSCSATSGAGAGGLTIDPRVGSVSRLLPMKAVVPFHLNPESHPSLITKSLRGASGSPTRSSNINNSEGDAKCTRASTSRACSPARAIPDAPIHSALSISTIGSLAFAVATQTVTSSSSSSSPSPRGSPLLRLSTQDTVATLKAQSSLAAAAPPQQFAAHSSQNVHTYGSISTSSPFFIPGGTPSSFPVEQLCCLLYIPVSITLLQSTHSSSSPSLSSSSSSSGSTRGRLQYLPEHDRQSPGRRSLISPICKERAKQPPAAPAPACPVGSGLRRTSSLDTLTGSYLAGHWPRDDSSIQCAPCMRDKATQTPKAWADECSEKRRSSHKRSASWGSTDQLKEIAKLRQQLQRSKHNSRRHRDKERKSAFNGNHVVISQSQAPVTKTFLIPVPKSTGSRFRNSMEGLNQEIERIIIRDSSERDEQLVPQDIPDGHRAPPPVVQRSSSTRSIDTQTPSGGGGGGGGNHSNSSSRSQSISPAFLAMANDTGGRSPCPSVDLLSDGRASTHKDLEGSSPLPKYAFSPRPNNSYMFKREPPEGCERIKAFEETLPRLPRDIPQFLCPDRNKVNFIPKSGSAFCLVSILKPLLPTQELTFKSSGALAMRSLSPSLGLQLGLEQEQRVSRGTCTSAPQPCLPFHLEEPES